MRAKILVIWMLSYLLGCFIAPVLPVNANTFWLSLLILGLSFLLLRRPYLFGAIFGFGVLLLSIWFFQSRALSYNDTNQVLSEKQMVTRLRVDDLPQNSLHGIKVSLVSVEGTTYKINGYFADGTELRYGQVIDTTIKVKRFTDANHWKLVAAGVSGESSISRYTLVGQDTSWFTIVRGYLLSIRQRFNESIARAFPAQEAGLASGIILGEKALVTPEMTRMLQASGTTHIIALSGYNVTIIMGLFIVFRRRMSRLMNLIIPGLFVLLFVIMTGAAASLVRAAIMGMMPLLARYLGRESDNFVAILFSACLMSILNPFLPLFDVGFQLSFVAIIGVIYLSPIIVRILGIFGESLAGTLAETLGAQAATFPLISYYFGIVSQVAPLTNVIILGLLPACMALVFGVGLFGMIWQPLASLLAVPTYFMLHFVNGVITWSGSLSWAATSIKIENPWWIFIAYLLIFDIWFFFGRVSRTRPTEE